MEAVFQVSLILLKCTETVNKFKMKLEFSLILICLSVCFLLTVQGSRHKRAVSRQKCPEKMSTEECKFYANQVKSTEICQGFNVQGNVIQWFTCGTVVCGDNTELVGENLSKSYPDCCSRCVVIDQSKPSSISGSL